MLLLLLHNLALPPPPPPMLPRSSALPRFSALLASLGAQMGWYACLPVCTNPVYTYVSQSVRCLSVCR